ncbi:hypothetical protein N0V91_008379 [Didymella pomorum]|uniref:Uncharacterized protein n=1 Tax=Didymella pomorum TaxID=749634 RepID=A0A9W8Z926_9PLEO|nr:hypothetical protein N0V91_008379 [Didymella pomorum]
MESYFLDKTFLITGGGSGIGRATAQMLASRGANISIADVVSSNLENTAAAIKQETPEVKILTTLLDVRDERAVIDWVTESERQLGPIHGCLNAAGIAPLSHFEKSIEDTPMLDWERTIAINLTGVMLCMREQVRVLKKQKTGGSIVNVTSAAGCVGIENGSPYSASKWGVIGLTRSVAKETASAGIRVTAVAP